MGVLFNVVTSFNISFKCILLFQLVIDETNRYAAECLAETCKNWEGVTVEEIKA